MENLVKEYKELSLNVLESLRRGEDVDIFIEKKDSILDKISMIVSNSESEKELLKKLIIKHDLKKIDDEVNQAFLNRKLKIKEEIKALMASRNGNLAYAKANVGSIYRSKA